MHRTIPFLLVLPLLGCATVDRAPAERCAELAKLEPPHRHEPAHHVPPDYPETAGRNGVEGDVEVAISVDADGAVEDVRVIDADPPGVFERAARRAVAKWRYCPADMIEYPSELRVTIPFRVTGTQSRAPLHAGWAVQDMMRAAPAGPMCASGR